MDYRSADAPVGPERRRHRRVPLKVPIECCSGEVVVSGVAENISLSGLLVRSPTPFAQHDLLTVSFSLPGSSQPVVCGARVAHLVPDAFMGLELVDLSPGDSRQIEAYVLSMAAVSGVHRG